MSQCEEMDLTCPSCGENIRAKIWSSVNVSLNPELKSRIIKGTINVAHCAGCGIDSAVECDVLYHDMTNRLMIWHKIPDENGEVNIENYNQLPTQLLVNQAYRFRLAVSRSQLSETVRIFDDGLDDRYIEIIKSMIEPTLANYPQPPSRLFYAGCARDQSGTRLKFELAALPGMEISSEIIYEKIEREYMPLLEPSPSGSPWIHVNREFANEIAMRKQPENWEAGAQSATVQKVFSVQEICRLANVQPYMIRFWAGEFPQLEAENRGAKGELYSRDMVELIIEIRRLLFDEGLTIAGARKRLGVTALVTESPESETTPGPRLRNEVLRWDAGAKKREKRPWYQGKAIGVVHFCGGAMFLLLGLGSLFSHPLSSLQTWIFIGVGVTVIYREYGFWAKGV